MEHMPRPSRRTLGWCAWTRRQKNTTLATALAHTAQRHTLIRTCCDAMGGRVLRRVVRLPVVQSMEPVPLPSMSTLGWCTWKNRARWQKNYGGHTTRPHFSDTHRAVGDRVLWGPGATKLTWEFESPYPYLCSLTRRHCHEVHRGPHEPTRLPLLYPTRRRARLAGRKLDNLRARALLPLPMRGVAATCAASIQANH